MIPLTKEYESHDFPENVGPDSLLRNQSTTVFRPPGGPMLSSETRLTAQLFTIPLDRNRHIVYAPLRRTAFVANSILVNFLVGLAEGTEPPETDTALVDFLRSVEVLDAGPEETPHSLLSGLPQPTSVTLFLTTSCNLRCTYCYASAGDTRPTHMPLEIATRGIDFVAHNAKEKGERSFSIGYHGGGEPTLNWKVMTHSLDYAAALAEKLELEVSAATATNGVLTDTQIGWIADRLSNATVSFDGLPSTQDLCRPTVTGEPSSRRVAHTLRKFDEAGFEYFIRMTVTKDQISSMADSVRFICEHFRPRSIQIEPAYPLGRWKEAPSAETEEFIAKFRESKEIGRQFGFEIFFSASRLDTLTNHFCGVSQDSFTLSTDGNVSSCYEVFSSDSPLSDTFFYGKQTDTSSGYDFDMRVLESLRSKTVNNNPFCESCFAKWHCAGDCLHRSLNTGGALMHGTDRCHITRELLKDLILERIHDSGGLFWHPCEP